MNPGVIIFSIVMFLLGGGAISAGAIILSDEYSKTHPEVTIEQITTKKEYPRLFVKGYLDWDSTEITANFEWSGKTIRLKTVAPQNSFTVVPSVSGDADKGKL